MFAKIDKKILIILIIVLAVILIAGFLVYKYHSDVANTENSLDGQGNNIPQFQIEEGGIQAQGENGGGGLTVCLDKCGDNICQEAEKCSDEHNLNCVCPETEEECPQDCS